MSQRGILRMWKDDKGFGFITPTGGGTDIFLHISAVENAIRRRPVVGDTIDFVATTEFNGKVRATNVRIVGVTVPVRINPAPYLAAAFCVGTGIYLMVRTGLPIVLTYPAIGAITYAVYAHDKAQAQAGSYRVPEATLHLLELLGGWFGAYLAQEQLRHKTAKFSYQTVFWIIVIRHGLGWAWWLFVTLSSAI